MGGEPRGEKKLLFLESRGFADVLGDGGGVPLRRPTNRDQSSQGRVITDRSPVQDIWSRMQSHLELEFENRVFWNSNVNSIEPGVRVT